jgi:hypothetical protein
MSEAAAPAWRTRRGVLTIVLGLLAVGLVATAVARAVRSFDLDVELAKTKSPVGGPIVVSGTCNSAVRTAWNRDSKDELKLWAVTVGTNMEGYTPVFGEGVKAILNDDELLGQFPDPWCAPEARHRLIISGWILAAAALLTVSAIVVYRRGTNAAHARLTAI